MKTYQIPKGHMAAVIFELGEGCDNKIIQQTGKTLKTATAAAKRMYKIPVGTERSVFDVKSGYFVPACKTIIF